MALLTVAVLCAARAVQPTLAQSGATLPKIPAYTVDRSWPQPLPNGWGIGPVSGISADRRDHVWIVHRTETVKQAGGVPAPPVIEFDPQGRVARSWGGPGPGYQWPEQLQSGAFVREQFIAKDTKGAGSVWDIEFSRDDRQQFLFVADGTNEKVWILDRATLVTLGSFGSSGREAGQFATPVHDLTMDSAGSIYTGEAATAGRIQKFTRKE